ncbi:MAG: hypothetical protein IJY21_02070 [Clostridia bacterium]|nr:hypothetical protein [Clostridia bacterium]
MQENRKRLLKSVYTVCFSVLTAVVGLLFIVQTWSIFRSAERGAFTVAKISEHFNQIAVPVVFWVLALIGNIVLGYVYPDGKEKIKPYFECKDRIKRLEKRLPKDSALRRRDRAETIGVAVGCLGLVFAAAAVVVSLVYLLDKTYAPVLPETIFVEHGGAADRLLRVLVWCGGAMAFLAAAVILNDYLAKRKEEKIKCEIAENAVKKKQAGEKAVATETEETVKTCKACKLAKLFGSDKAVWCVRAAVGIVGLVFVITGICNGGMADVLKKAINICTQCIGLG